MYRDQYLFKSNSIFDKLSERELQFIQSKMVLKKFKKGRVVFQEGNNPAGIHFVEEGMVKKYKTGTDGKEQIFYICKKGDFFGYAALLSEESYPDSAAVMEDSIIAFIPKNDFLTILDQSDSLSKALLKNLSHEFGVLVNSITVFAQKSVRERLALCLLILYDRFKVKEESDVEINLSRGDLANMVGTAKETLVRLLRDFKQEKLIEANAKIIKIQNLSRLIKVANFY